MNIYSLPTVSWQSNCYVIISTGDDNKMHAAIVDPSISVSYILQFVKDHGAHVDLIILTHGHFDHVASLDELRALTDAPVLIHSNDDELLDDGDKNAYSLFFGKPMSYRRADRLVSDGDIITLGNDKIKVISTPGHTKGSVCLLCPEFLITGDTLFAEGFGRYDLYGGDIDELRRSLISMQDLDPDLLIYPGHGPSVRLGRALENIYLI